MKTITSIYLSFVFGCISCSLANKNEPDLMEMNGDANKVYYLRSVVKASEVGDNYIYCDTTAYTDLSCFLNYRDKKYLKREKVSFDSSGNFRIAFIFKPEGYIKYSQEELMRDTLLAESMGWKIYNNVIEVDSNIIKKPFSGVVLEKDIDKRTIYFSSNSLDSDRKILYVIEYW